MATYEREATIPLPREAAEPVVTQGRMPFGRYVREIGWRHLVGIAAVAFALYPVAWMFTSSINSVDSLTTVRFIPDSITTDNYTALFDGCSFEFGFPPFGCDTTTPFPVWLFNTVKVALFATIIQLAFSALAAYSFARLRWRGRRTGLIIILLIQMFPQFLAFVAIFALLDILEDTFPEPIQVAMWVAAIPIVIAAILVVSAWFRGTLADGLRRWVPWIVAVAAAFAVWAFVTPGFGVSIFPKIGFNTHTGLILVYLGGAIGVNTWLIKGFMDSIPTSLDEAAKVDGATEFEIFWRIIVPLTRPILIVIFFLSFVGLYNEYILARVLIQDVDQFTYATGLDLFVESEYSAKWGQLTAAAVIGTTPIVVMFMLAQDRIVSGLTGAVKG